MHRNVTNPPATVYDTFLAYLEGHGIVPDSLPEDERARTLELVCFVYSAAIGRLCTALPPPQHCRRSTDAVALQVLAEVQRALQEVAHLGSAGSPPGVRTN